MSIKKCAKSLIVSFMFLVLTVFPGTSYGSTTAQLSQKEFVEGYLETVREHTYWVQNYKYGYWDCTNQATVLYTALAMLGIQTKIVTGRFDGSRNWHAMLEVVLDGKEYRIEPVDLTFYETRDLGKGWREWSKHSLENARWIWPWEFSCPVELESILFTSEE